MENELISSIHPSNQCHFIPIVIASSCPNIDALFKHPSMSDLNFVYNLVSSNLSHHSLLPHLTLLAAGRGDKEEDHRRPLHLGTALNINYIYPPSIN